ncbi:MAG: YihY/virulence factor BrkB family protein [Anaerolineales bacterium]|nr:YihY/virulence factor BrkB family protein [Anaerolineales bacterium]
MNLKIIWGLLKETFSDWSEDKASRLAAALAYYTIFSIAPLIIIVIAVAGLVFGREAAQGQIEGQIQGLVGDQGGELIQEMVQGASNQSTGVIATIIGVATLLFGATGVFGQLQDALNTIWEVTPKPGRGVLGILKDRFISFTMVLGIGFLLTVSLVLSAGLAAASQFTGLDKIAYLGEAITFFVSFAVITLLFAMIYKILPDVKIAWSDVWIGATVTALLFTIGKLLISLYLGHSALASSFGAAGALVVILVWIYYSAQILFFGAEFTQVYAKRFGSRIRPDEDAVPVTEEARAQQGMPRTGKEQPTAPSGEKQDARTAGNVPSMEPVVAKQASHPKPVSLLVGLVVGFILDRIRGKKKDEVRV